MTRLQSKELQAGKPRSSHFTERLLSHRLQADARHNQAAENSMRHGIENFLRESYSEFGEDRVVSTIFERRAIKRFGDISKLDKGFYVDVGCFDPILFSNTYWFYKRGWSGINVDAAADVKSLFDLQRPRDHNVHALVSSEKATDVAFYTWDHSPYNNCSREDSDKLVRLGKVKSAPNVEYPPVYSLEDILNKHCNSTHIDFMSVDTEGFDYSVLASNNWEKYRPEFILVEDDVKSLNELMTSQIYTFLRNNSYECYAWTPPTIIFHDTSVVKP